MSWQWLLISIGLYIAAGMITAGVDAYYEGVIDRKDEHPDQTKYSDDAGPIVFLWPLFIAVNWIPQMFNTIYTRSKSRLNRKLAKQGRKAQDQAFKELCKQNGWDYKQVKAAQGSDRA
jgi:hypothetical protein